MENLEVIAPRIAQAINTYNRQTGNSFVNSTYVMKILFPAGTMGKEQEYDTTLRVVDKLFAVANAPPEAIKQCWEEINGLALNAINATRL